MARFKNALKGYDKTEVDEYIHKNTEFLESKIKELQTCVEHLKEENNYLYSKNGEYRRNEERVSTAIIRAMEYKDKLEEEMKAKISLEEERLRLFKQKWTAYAKGINASNADRVVEDIDGYIQTFKQQFIRAANTNLNIKSETQSSGAITGAEKAYVREQLRLKANLPQSANAAAADTQFGTENDEISTFLGFNEE